MPNDLKCPEDYPDQLEYENYLDRLLEGYTLKFVTNRIINETMPDPYLIINRRLCSIVSGIHDVIECRDLNLHFEWCVGDEVLLHNYKPNFEKGCGHDENNCDECDNGCFGVYIYDHESDKCIVIGLKINGTNIECIDYSH